MNPQQNRLFLFEQKRIKGGAFSIPIKVSFSENLCVDLLSESLGYLVERHINLRSAFEQPQSIPHLTLSSHPLNIEVREEAIELKIDEFVKDDARRGFDILNGPLYRFFIFQGIKRTILYLNFHHLIWDGSSTSVFLNELNIVYSSLKKNEVPRLKNLDSGRYENYRKRLRKFSEDWGESFKQKLMDFYNPLGVLELPVDYIRPKEFSHHGEMTEFELSGELYENILNICSSYNINPYSFFSSCFSLLLYRYSRQETFYQGTPLLGRFSREDINSTGFYVQTGLIPCEVKENKSIKNFLTSHHDNIIKAQHFKRFPIEELFRIVDSDFDQSRTQGYQCFFMYQDFSNKKMEVDGISYERKHLDSGIAHSDLDLWIALYRNKISGGFHFPICLFKKSSIELIQQEFLSIVNFVVENENSSVGDIPISKEHKKRIKNEFININNERSDSLLVHFRKKVLEYPQKVAVKSTFKSLTYEELDILSNRFSHFLFSIGVQNGDLIAVSVERTADLLIALLGILKADCCYLPIDSKFPKDRIAYMMEHSGAKKIVVDDQTKDSFKNVELVNLQSFLNESNQFDQGEVDFKSNGDQSAYIIYTSGSTGKPKGVEISIRAMSNFLLSMKNEPGMKAGDTLCAVTTLSFDISVLELFLPIICGGTVFIASSEEAKNSQILSRILIDHQITIMQATPITWRLLFNSGWDGMNTIKVLCGGEKVPSDLAKELARSCHSLWNMYGPTETTVWSTCKELKDDNELISIGYPIRETSIHILDSKKNYVPIGAIGEIYIGGAGLAKGYLHQKDLTEERFVTIEGERYYRTGDQGRLTSWNEILCLGRLDHQVKIRGHRIELGEIEYQLSQINQVKQSVVVIREDVPGDKKLVAYFTLKEKITETKIKDSILNSLPPYMLPELFVTLDEMPLTPNGKVDQKNLPSPYRNREVVDENLTLAETDTEKKIAEIWKRELRIPNVYKEDNFFNIGGNSLIAASVFHKMSLSFKCNLELALLFEFPNLTLLANEIDALKKGKQRKFSNIIRLNKGTNGKNLFFFHAIGGNTLNYRIFLDQVMDYNCYGVQSDGVDGLNLQRNSVETMAESYVRQILKVDADGPYHLIGGSLGGLLAFEVARLLRNRRKEISSLIMFDTAVPQRKRSKIDQISRQEKNSFRTFGFDQIRRRILSIINFVYRQFNLPVPISLRVPLLEFYNFLALKRFRPKDYDGDIYMIRIPIKEKGIYARKDLGWGDYVHGKIEADYIDAPHEEFIESPEVAKVFGEYLKRRF